MMEDQDVTKKKAVVKQTEQCRHCDQPVTEHTGFCPHCGKLIERNSGNTTFSNYKLELCPECQQEPLHEGEQICEFCQDKQTINITLFKTKTNRLSGEGHVKALIGTKETYVRRIKKVVKRHPWILHVTIVFFLLTLGLTGTLGFLYVSRQSAKTTIKIIEKTVVVVQTPIPEPTKTEPQSQNVSTYPQTTNTGCGGSTFPIDSQDFPYIPEGCVAIIASEGGFIQRVDGNNLTWQTASIIAVSSGKLRNWQLYGRSLPIVIVAADAGGNKQFCQQYETFSQKTGGVIQQPYAGWETC